MIQVEFLKDFATRKQGDILEMDPQTASGLIKRKIVKVKTVSAKPKPKTAAKKPKTSNKTTK